MGRDITLGQYYPTDSIIHRLDPRVKLLGTLIYLVSLFVFNGIVGFIVASVALFGVIFISGIPLGYVLRGIKGVYILVIITAVFNLFFTSGTPLVVAGTLVISKEGVQLAILMSIRIIYLVMGASVMTLSTTPGNLAAGLEKGLSFLKVFGVPVHDFAMMMTIALRFIPILMEEADKIKKAQMSRGADFEAKNLIKRAKSYVPILVPLFVSAFRRANDLSVAMESRCYQGKGTARLNPLIYQKSDLIAYIVIAAYFVGIIVTRVLAVTH